MSVMTKEKNRIQKRIKKLKKQKKQNFPEFKELKLKYNKIRKEIEIEKLSNIELHNEIQAQINYDMGHKKAWKKVKNEFNGHKMQIH